MAQLAEQPTARTPRVGKQGILRHGDLRRRRRSHRAHADSRAVQPGRADLLSKEFAMLGVARDQCRMKIFASGFAEDVKQYCGDCIDTRPGECFVRRFYYFAGRFQRRQPLRKVEGSSGEDRSATTPRIRTSSIIMATAPVSSARSWKSWPPLD